MRLLCFDLETTGLLEDETALPVELAWVIWDTTGYNRIVAAQSMLIEHETPVPEAPVALHGIDHKLTSDMGWDPRSALESFANDVSICDGLLTRNGVGFDWPMLCRLMDKVGFGMSKPPIIDDYLDIPYPASFRGNSLSYVAADHGFLNPFPHTALGDAMTLVRVMQVGKYDMHEALQSAMNQAIKVRAALTYDDKVIAEKSKFKWDPKTSVWQRSMRKHKYDAAEYPFKTDFVGI